MASNDIDFQPKSKQGKFSGAREFLYNPENKSFLGRTCVSWAKIGLFYLVFYSCLAGFFAIWLSIFFTSIDSNQPKQYGMTSLLKNNPGMGFRPQPEVESTLIHFEQGKPESYTVYTQNIKDVLDNYENEAQDGENFIDCANLDDDKRDKSKVCRFIIEDLGEECTREREYGYDEGQPCVLLKLNKIYAFQPTPYTNDTLPQAAIEAGINGRDGNGPSYSDHSVGITCEGENPADEENMGPIEFWPPYGWDLRYYPFLAQEGYRQPLVMVKFKKPQNGVIIQVWCKAWSQEITHHKNDKAGSVHFELLID